MLPTLPGTAVPGFHVPPLRGWSVLSVRGVFSGEVNA
jgi:hypothetical protein